MIDTILFQKSLDMLQNQFLNYKWEYLELPGSHNREKILYWPGKMEDDILILVHDNTPTLEPFHRHDYFYFNYTYKGFYKSLSHRFNQEILIQENELYAGQPFAGHALRPHDRNRVKIIGILIQKTAFFHYYLPLLSGNRLLFHFFFDPSIDSFSDEYLHFHVSENDNIRTLLELMVIEYANNTENKQDILKSLCLTFLQMITRYYNVENTHLEKESPADQVVRYISEHLDSIDLNSCASFFSYSPNYLSNLLKKTYGASFSSVVLQQRMERAAFLLMNTTISISEIALLLGYASNSHFYQTFREYYNVTPREYVVRYKSDH